MPAAQESPGRITKISVTGFKSLRDEQSIEIRPLTILAGANSSGKSSILQPLLLLKQTLEESYDPGPLLLNGPNVRFSKMDQLLWHSDGEAQSARTFRVRLATAETSERGLTFTEYEQKPSIVEMTDTVGGESLTLREGMDDAEIRSKVLPRLVRVNESQIAGMRFYVSRDRWRLRVSAPLALPSIFDPTTPSIFPPLLPGLTVIQWSLPVLADEMSEDILSMIHLPGLRGEPRRTYPLAAVGSHFPGTFHNYTASVIASWKEGEEGKEKLAGLAGDLERLELAWQVEATSLDAAQVEVKVSRLPKSKAGGAAELVNIADVGFGVSQVLPVLVALRVAGEGQMVYLEQPEIHLHPNAQARLAEVIAAAARRGVRVVVETHSSLLLLAVQALVAKGELPAGDVGLNWFRRDDDGATRIESGSLNEAGEYGDWPEDFADVELALKRQYLRAAAAHVPAGDDPTPPGH